MQKPDLSKMWRTWIKIGPLGQPLRKMLQNTIRQKLQPILQLKKDGEIAWFYFLLHPKPDDPTNAYFDVVFTSDKEDPKNCLPKYCISTKKIDPIISISGVDREILRDDDIRYAWKIIGEQSEFIINFVCSHKEDRDIHQTQIAQFMHFFMNSLGNGHRSVFFPRGDPNQVKYLMSKMPKVSVPGGQWIQF